MIRLRVGFLLMSMVVVPGSLAGQASRVVEPANGFLLGLTQEWGRSSALGDLKAAALGPAAIELRFWGGYGLAGTRGVVLRSDGRTWSAHRTIVHRCYVGVPSAALDSASLLRYQAEAKRSCGPPTTGGGYVVKADSVEVVPVGAQADLGQVWRDAVALGLLDLPPEPGERRFGFDGLTYVVELRQGPEYRASVIRHVRPPRTEADAQVQAIYRLLDERLTP
jgi:hypothetical protein